HKRGGSIRERRIASTILSRRRFGRRKRFMPPTSIIAKFHDRYSSPRRPAPTILSTLATKISALLTTKLPKANCCTLPMPSPPAERRGDKDVPEAAAIGAERRVTKEPVSTVNRAGCPLIAASTSK